MRELTFPGIHSSTFACRQGKTTASLLSFLRTREFKRSIFQRAQPFNLIREENERPNEFHTQDCRNRSNGSQSSCRICFRRGCNAPGEEARCNQEAKTPPPPTVAEQIQTLRQDLENQINSLKTDLADKDAQLKKAQQAAADAQAAADRAQAAATTGQQAVSENAAAVSTLQSTVTGHEGR